MLALRKTAASLGLLVALGAGPALAATDGYMISNLNLRSGPGTDYPVVVTMPAGDLVTIYGCISDWSWCDIDWRRYRGWAAGDYLQVMYRQQRQPIISYGADLDVPFLSFSIGSYWNDHYRRRNFYGQMQRYRSEGVGPPPPPPPGFPPPPHGKRPPRHDNSNGNPPPPPPGSPPPPHHDYVQPPVNGNPPLLPNTGNPPSHKGKLKGPPTNFGRPPKELHVNPPPNTSNPPKGKFHKLPPPKGTAPQCPKGQHFVNGACQ
jgi:uncharacterized protein YraI